MSNADLAGIPEAILRCKAGLKSCFRYPANAIQYSSSVRGLGVGNKKALGSVPLEIV